MTKRIDKHNAKLRDIDRENRLVTMRWRIKHQKSLGISIEDMLVDFAEALAVLSNRDSKLSDIQMRPLSILLPLTKAPRQYEECYASLHHTASSLNDA